MPVGRQRRSEWLRAALLLTAAVSGCALPNYQLPRGFSSTYYRHMQQQFLPFESAPPMNEPIGPLPPTNGMPRTYVPPPVLPQMNPPPEG